MPVEAKPLFRPDVLRAYLSRFSPPPSTETSRLKFQRWAEMLRSGEADRLGERELLPDFITDLFIDLLGYQPPPGLDGRFTLSRERHVHNTTFGGGATEDVAKAGGQTGPRQIMLREIEVYGKYTRGLALTQPRRQ